ncbi:MAG: hypothetical protein KGJ13_02215 [Patescibacteria group bacterium]|nr:hypothetical protein [Patescibacteria group bacterium]
MKKLLILLSVLVLTLSVKAQIPTRSQLIGQYIAATVGINQSSLQNYLGTFGMLYPYRVHTDTTIFADSVAYTCPSFAWNGATATGGLDTIAAVKAYCAHPFWVNPGMTVSALEVKVGVLGASDTGDLGIYADNGYGYPGALVIDGGKFAATATGIKIVTFSSPVALTANTLYWFVVASDTTTASFIGAPLTAKPTFLGMNLKDWSSNVGWVTTNTFAWNPSNALELPATFPSKGAMTDAKNGVPAIWAFH